jgi:hypothetical protein
MIRNPSQEYGTLNSAKMIGTYTVKKFISKYPKN